MLNLPIFQASQKTGRCALYQTPAHIDDFFKENARQVDSVIRVSIKLALLTTSKKLFKKIQCSVSGLIIVVDSATFFLLFRTY